MKQKKLKELNQLAAFLHVYFYEVKQYIIIFQKENGNTYFYTFNHFYSEKSSKGAK